MKKRKDTRTDNYSPEDRKRKINYKKKKQREDESYFNPKRLGRLEDFDEFEEDEGKAQAPLFAQDESDATEGDLMK